MYFGSQVAHYVLCRRPSPRPSLHLGCSRLLGFGSWISLKNDLFRYESVWPTETDGIEQTQKGKWGEGIRRPCRVRARGRRRCYLPPDPPGLAVISIPLVQTIRQVMLIAPSSPEISISATRRRIASICKSSHFRPCSLSNPFSFSSAA